jgi:hypothetical protein
MSMISLLPPCRRGTCCRVKNILRSHGDEILVLGNKLIFTKCSLPKNYTAGVIKGILYLGRGGTGGCVCGCVLAPDDCLSICSALNLNQRVAVWSNSEALVTRDFGECRNQTPNGSSWAHHVSAWELVTNASDPATDRWKFRQQKQAYLALQIH